MLNGIVAFTVALSPLRVRSPGMFVVLMSSGLCWIHAPTERSARAGVTARAVARARSPIVFIVRVSFTVAASSAMGCAPAEDERVERVSDVRAVTRARRWSSSEKQNRYGTTDG